MFRNMLTKRKYSTIGSAREMYTWAIITYSPGFIILGCLSYLIDNKFNNKVDDKMKYDKKKYCDNIIYDLKICRNISSFKRTDYYKLIDYGLKNGCDLSSFKET